MIPDNDHIGCSIRQVGQFLTVGTSGHVVHCITDLKRLTKCGAAWLQVHSVWAFENLVVLLDERPKQAFWIVVIERFGHR